MTGDRFERRLRTSFRDFPVPVHTTANQDVPVPMLEAIFFVASGLEPPSEVPSRERLVVRLLASTGAFAYTAVYMVYSWGDRMSSQLVNLQGTTVWLL